MASNHLQHARALELPPREAMLRRDHTVQQFWADNSRLLVDAWAEWDESEADSAAMIDGTLIDPRLRSAVAAAWDDPTQETGVRDLLDEPAPGVYSFQLFDPERLDDLRRYLDSAWDAGIPMRPPYGIVLNRRGAMLDERSDGYLGAPSFQTFYRSIMDTYMRPIARMLFGEVVGYDSQTFGFSINYQPSTDTSIRPHSDASSVTLNVNVNRLSEDFTGSEVDFYDQATGGTTSLSFEPGLAMIHRGSEPHAARPITSGERTNLVLWLFGDGGQVPMGGRDAVLIDAADRWKNPVAVADAYAPF